MKVIAVTGLPGSGKSYFAYKLAGLKYFIIDDPTDTEEIQKFLDAKVDIVVVDQSLTLEKSRSRFEQFIQSAEYEIEWIFFENNPGQCRKNVERRQSQGDERQISLASIEGMSGLYTVPDGNKIVPVWREVVRCPTCKIEVPAARFKMGYKTCIKHSDEKTKDHQPGVVNSLGLHEKYFPEGR